MGSHSLSTTDYSGAFTLSLRMVSIQPWPLPSFSLLRLKTVALTIRMGSSPMSGTIRKPKPAERSTGFDFTTAKLFIVPLFPPLRHLDPLETAHPFPPLRHASFLMSDVCIASSY
jgi:hypothetical protein